MKIEVQNSKPYIAKVTGKSEQYGTKNEFLPESQRKSASYRVYDVIEDGTYKCPAGDTRVFIEEYRSLRIDTGFFTITEGVAKEVTKEEVLASL